MICYKKIITTLSFFKKAILFNFFASLIFIGSSYAADPFPYNVEVWVKNLKVPWQIVVRNGDAYFTERVGRVRIVRNGKLQKQPWATIPETRIGGEGGLLGIALDPQFEKNGFIYFAYTYGKGRKAIHRLVRFKEQTDARGDKIGRLDKVLNDGIVGAANHNGGTLKIGPDKKLYWSVGDRYQEDLAQDLKSYQGKILRLELDGSVPDDNPFSNSLVFSLGHRNPQGIAFHPKVRGFLATEHGPSGLSDCCRDELNWVRKGRNYGWPIIRGDERKEGLESPLINSGENKTWAPSGAVFVKEGPWKDSLLFTALRGRALYRVQFFSLSPSVKVEKIDAYLENKYGRLRDIAAGDDGHYYLLTSNRDGRGQPRKNDDVIFRLSLKNSAR